jgi:hypothetical protein
MAGGALAPIQTSTGSAGRSARLALATRNLDVLDRDALLTLAAVTVEGFGQSREQAGGSTNFPHDARAHYARAGGTGSMAGGSGRTLADREAHPLRP